MSLVSADELQHETFQKDREQRGLPPAMRVHRVGIQEEVVIDDKEWKDMMKMQLDIAVRHNALNFIAANN